MKLGPEQNVNMPLKTVLSLITLVSIFTFSYFQITERLNNLETQDTLMQSDLLKKADQTPRNLEIFMLIEHNSKILDRSLIDNQKLIQISNYESMFMKLCRFMKKNKDLYNKYNIL